MTKTTVKRTTRSCCHEGRKFVIRYELEPLPACEAYLIRASLEEMGSDGKGLHALPSTVEVMCPYRNLGEKLFELISNTPDPVFPVHLPEILRDQIACTVLDSLSVTWKTSPS